MSQPQSTTADVTQAKLALSQLMEVRYTDDPTQFGYTVEQFNELVPYMDRAISDAQTAITLAEGNIQRTGSTSVDLGAFQDPQTMFRGGFVKEERDRAIAGANAQIQDIQAEIQDIDTELVSGVITAERQVELEERKRLLGQELGALRSGAMFRERRGMETKPLYLSSARPEPTVMNTLRENAAQAAYENVLDATDDRVQAERARQEVYNQAFAPVRLDVAGGPSRMARIADPTLNIDLATGTRVDPETGVPLQASTAQLIGAALRPQVVAIREDQDPRRAAMQQRQTLEQALERGEYLETVSGQKLEDILQRVTTTPSRRDPSVLVESPPMYALRVAFAIPTAATGLAAEALTYDIDEQGNPIDPNDLTFQVQNYLFRGATPSYGGYPLLGIDVANIPERRQWADASSTFNLALSSIADGVSFYEIKNAMPAMNVEETAFDTVRSTIIGGAALGFDFLMPAGPLELVSTVPKAMRGGLRAARKQRSIPIGADLTLEDIKNGDFLFKFDDAAGKYRFGFKTDKIEFTPLGGIGDDAIVNINVDLNNVDDWLTAMSEISLFGAPSVAVKSVARKQYQYELNRLVDEAFDNRTSMESIGGRYINNVQDAAAREISINLTDLVMARVYGASDDMTDWARKTLDNYVEYSNLSRVDVDNPFRITITVSEAIANDLRMIREGTQLLPSSFLYTSAFRNNLVRAAVKNPRWKNNQILRDVYKRQTFEDVPEALYKAVIKDRQVVEEAVYRTLRSVTKEQLYNRLPIDMMFVAGGRRIINFAQNTKANQLKVGAMVEQVNQPTVVEGGFRLGKNTDEQVELFIDGVGIDEIRQSRELQQLLDKLNRNDVLTQSEYSLVQDYFEAGAWTSVIDDAYQPVLMSPMAYQNATELRSNDVFLQRSEEAALQYLSKSNIKYGTKTYVKQMQTIKKEGPSVVMDVAGLSYVQKLSKEVYITPKPYLDLRETINALRSTEYDAFNARLDTLFAKHKNGGVALGVAMNEAVETLISARQQMMSNRYKRQFDALTSGGMNREEAIEQALKSIMEQQSNDYRFNSYMAGRQSSKGLKPELNIRKFIIEETRKEILTDYFDKFFFLPEVNKQGLYERILRNAAQSETPITPQYLYEIYLEMLENPTLAGKLEFNNLRTLKYGKTIYTTDANLETALMFTLALRSKVRFNSQIEVLMAQHPSMYIDMVVSPIQNLYRESQPDRLVRAAREQGTKYLERIMGRPAQEQIETTEDLLAILLSPSRDANVMRMLNIEDIAQLESKISNDDLAKLVKRLDDALEETAKVALFSTAKQRAGIGNSMIEGMIHQKLGANDMPTQSFVALAMKQNGGPFSAAFSELDSVLDEFVNAFRYKSAADRTVTQNKVNSLRNVLLSNTMGLNMSYTGNMSDLQFIKTGAFANSQIATTPLQILEHDIDQMLRSYGIVFGTEQLDRSMSTILQNYRPILGSLDEMGINMFMGKEFADDVARIKDLANGKDFRQTLEVYRAITRVSKDATAMKEFVNARQFGQLFDALARVQMTGLLGGSIVMNISYLAQNLLTMPLVMLPELGSNRIISLIKPIMDDIMGVANPKNSTIKDSDIFIKTRTGRNITFGEYKNLLTTEEIATTFSASQFSSSSMSELIRTLRADSELVEILEGQVKYKGNVGWATTVGRYIDPRVRTYFTMVSHHSDMVFRRAVFAQALEEGMAPSMAGARSRGALYDYGASRSTAIKQALGKYIGFFSFLERSLMSTLKSITTRKSEALRMLRAQDIYNKNQEGMYVGDSRQMSRLWSYMVEQGTEKNLYVGGPLNPLYESFALITNSMALVMSFDSNAVAEAYQDVLDRKPLLPLYMTLYTTMTKTAGNKRNPYDATTYLPSAYMPLMTNQSIRQQLMMMYDLKSVPALEGRPTFRGQTYQFQTSEGYNAFIRHEMFLSLASIHRSMLDNLKAASIGGLITDPQYDRGYYHAVNSWSQFTGESLMWKQLEGAAYYHTTILRPEQRPSVEGIFLEEDLRRKQALEALQ